MKQGMQYEYGKRLGKKTAEKMYMLSKEIVKFSVDDLQEMIEHYQKELKKMGVS